MKIEGRGIWKNPMAPPRKIREPTLSTWFMKATILKLVIKNPPKLPS